MSKRPPFPTLRICHSGDIGDYRDVILNGVEDLVNVASLEAHVSKSGTTATLTATVQDADDRIVRIELGDDPGDWLPAGPSLGDWIGQIEVVFSDGTELTWPAVGCDTGFFTITVVRSLG